MRLKGFFAVFGPGIIFAAAAIGVSHPDIPIDYRPSTLLRVFAGVGIACLALFSLFFLVWRFF